MNSRYKRLTFRTFIFDIHHTDGDVFMKTTLKPNLYQKFIIRTFGITTAQSLSLMISNQHFQFQCCRERVLTDTDWNLRVVG